jgi:hypothetical protein
MMLADPWSSLKRIAKAVSSSASSFAKTYKEPAGKKAGSIQLG